MLKGVTVVKFVIK